MSFHKKVLLLAIIWYSLTAFFSIGYFHPDEHYQIIEFAGLLDGTNTPEDLTWEYESKIRSATQPIICYSIFKICDLLSIISPFHKAFILRFLTGLLAVFSIYFFANSCRRMVLAKYWKPFLIISYFIWFLPFINVRFSSETLAGITFLFSLSLIIRNKKNYKTYIATGALIGLSFLFRFQIAIAALGLFLWLIFIRKEKLSTLLLIVFAGISTLFIGVLLDFWFYKEPVFAFWNYLNSFFYDGKEVMFGTSPWYYYITHGVIFSLFPIGIIIITSLLILLFKKPKNIFIWIILPFIITHSAIAHKEMRFLFPLINFLPIIVILAIQEFNFSSISKRSIKIIYLLIFLTFMINSVGLIFASFEPPGLNSRVKIIKKIDEISSGEKASLYYIHESNPFLPWSLTTNFYKQDNIILNNLENPIRTIDENNRKFLIVRKSDLTNVRVENFILKNNMKEVCKGVPDLIFIALKKWTNKSGKTLILYSNEDD